MTLFVVIYIILLFVFVSALYPLRSYSGDVHARALKKTIFILLLSILPPALGVLFIKGNPFKLLYGELFIYTASYLSPVVYWFYERKRHRDKIIRGDVFTLFYAILILLLTAVLFGAYKSDPDIFIEGYLYFSPWFILALTIILWYSVIAENEDVFLDFVGAGRREEDQFLREIVE